MIKVAIIGSGNVAWSLAKCFYANSGVLLHSIIGRNKYELEQISSEFGGVRWSSDYSDAKYSDIVILAVKDSAISEVSARLAPYISESIVCHVSAAASLDSVDNSIKNRGVFYLLQTFTKGIDVNFDEIPIFIQADKQEVLNDLKKLAYTINNKVYQIDEVQRLALHVSATFACNFTNRMFYYCEKLLKQYSIDKDVIIPLIKHTVDKYLLSGLEAAQLQTGPAVRGDMETISRHRDMLNSNMLTVYNTITNDILNDNMKNFKEDILTIKAFVFDCDGVLTDGSILVSENGEALRIFNTKDGFGLAAAIKQGYPIAIISGGSGVSMEKRMLMLGVKDLYMGCRDKVGALKQFAEKYNLELKDILYMGDDVPDMEAMESAGLATAPYDAMPEVKSIAKYVSDYPGGRGCVRDVIEQVMRSQGKWMSGKIEISVVSQ